MRKIASRFFDTKTLGITCSLIATAGLLGCIIALSAMADGDIIINLDNNTTVNESSRVIRWDFENNEFLNLTVDNGPDLHAATQNSSNHLSIPSGNSFYIKLSYGDDGELCSRYEASLSSDGWAGSDLTCDSNGKYFVTQPNIDISGVTSGIVLQVRKKNNNPSNPGGNGQGNDPTRPIIVNIPAESFNDETHTATFNFNQESRDITFGSAWNVGNNTRYYEFTYTSQEALKEAFANTLSLTATGACMVNPRDGQQGDQYDNYYVRLESGGGWGKNYDCNNGQYTLSFTNEDNINPSDSFSIRVIQKVQPQVPANVEFENAGTLGENGSYILVTSHDDSLAGKTFRITPASGEIQCNTNNNERHCEQVFNDSPFDENSEFFYYISGEGFNLNTEEMMVFLRGAPGTSGVAAISSVGGNYLFMLKGNGIPVETNHISIAIEEPHEYNNGPEEQQHAGDPVPATNVTLKSNIGDSPIAKSFYLSRISINNKPVTNKELEYCGESNEHRADSTKCPESYTLEDFTYNKEANVSTVEIDFGTLFNMRFINSVKVNGTAYQIPFNYTDRQEWLAHYDHQMTGFRIDNVPYNENGYTIEVDVDELAGQYQQIGNFLWSNDEREKFRPDGSENDEYIGHSNLEVVSVNCHITENDAQDVFFRVGIDEIPAGCVFEYQPDSDKNPTGSLVVPEGSTITVRVKPIYGWQVTSFRISGGAGPETDPGAVAQYTFGIRKGNAHLGAVVTKVNDEVNATSEKVKSGSISLGGEEIAEGTAMLTVGDADLTNEQKEEFQAQAGNYNVSTFLDIDLDQVFYNGKGEYWQGAEMSELEHEATITLTLEEGIDGNSVILVHKKHDGTYEIIPTTYNATTNTISFKTSSFSDYAIASATVANANTRDSIIAFFAVFLISANASIILFAQAKKEAAKESL